MAGPRCPNHAVYLTDCNKGVGICPVSGVTFTYKEDKSKTKRVKHTDGTITEESVHITEGDD